MIEMIGFGLYQSCENGESVGPVFGLRWYGGVGVGGGGCWAAGLDQGLEGLCYVCVRCESGFTV